ncbi:carbonic anhydrase [Phaeosphaeria sp. MPI-PUGE-AT-0046c]|nr:carbonic anhydrase [Phaeosphaeria sp. MPI-PUGE-AT-0046c]
MDTPSPEFGVYKAQHPASRSYSNPSNSLPTITAPQSPMAPNTTIERFLSGNAKWRPGWKTPPPMTAIRKNGLGPENPLMIVTCMDPRCDPAQFLGGDLIFGSVRNAGGRITPDTIASIVTLRSLNLVSEGGTVAVVHHTDCGMTHLTTQGIRDDVKKRTPGEAGRANEMEFGAFAAEDFEETIRKDVQVLKEDKLLAGMDVFGFAFITETGELKVVE